LKKNTIMELASGFRLFKTRKVEEQINLKVIEAQFGFSLPPLYKLFVSTFHLGKNSFKQESFLNPKQNDYYNFQAPLYYPLKDNEKWFLSVSYFDSIEQICRDWESYMRNEKEWTDFGFLRIAGIGQGGGLFVGTRSENADVIYEVVWDWEEPYYKVADNIFELIKGFTYTDSDKLLADGYSRSQLYKNWGEDFWRVRE